MAPLPNQLGRYEIREELGKGAMGIVYLARDPLIGRLVALKTFRLGFSAGDRDIEQFRARFIREAQSAGILSHPGIVTVHDVVERSEEGLAFIAMEYVRGTNLKMLLQGDAPLELSFVADVISQIAAALDYAHAHGVIHRDVKPANVILTGDGKVKLTDFGIARLDSSNLTQEGQMLGTPNYMAPEQVMGKEVDHRADLFSLGVVLYEMLTGHKPFQGENLTVVSHRIVYDPFTPPRDYARELPLGVEQILDRALEKEPAKRFQKAKEMVEELRRVLGGPRSAAAVPAPPPPPQRFPLAAEASSQSALNDTQSLSSTVVHPPSDLPPLGSTASRTAARLVPPPPPPLPSVPALPSLDDTAEVPPVAAPPAPGKPAAKGKGKGTAEVGRWVGLVAAVLAVAVVGVAAYKLALDWRRPEPAPPAPVAPSTQAQVEGLVLEAQRLLGRQDYSGAVVQLRRAEALEPENAVIRNLRQEAERTAQLLANAKTQGEQVEAQLALARQALAAKRFAEAATAATAVLQLSPGQPEATDLLAKAQAGAQAQARKRQQKSLPGSSEAPQTVAATPSVADEPAATAPAASESQEATLSVSLFSQYPRGTLIVYVDRTKVLQEPFTFVERGGLFRSKTAPGELRRSVPVKAGTAKIGVYVTPAGKKAQVTSFNGNFLGGGTRSLEIQLSETGEMTAHLN